MICQNSNCITPYCTGCNTTRRERDQKGRSAEYLYALDQQKREQEEERLRPAEALLTALDAYLEAFIEVQNPSSQRLSAGSERSVLAEALIDFLEGKA